MNKKNVTKVNFDYRSKLTLKTTNELLKDNKVGLFMPDLFISFYYPIDTVSERVKNYLFSGIPLSSKFEKIRKDLHHFTDESPYFIHSLLTHWYLDDRITDLREGGYSAIGATKRISLMDYVSAYGYENIFFVIGGDGEGVLRCIEVHKRKPITYRTVFLLSTQVTKTKRLNSGVSALTFDELFLLEEPELSRRLMEVGMAETAFKQKYLDDSQEDS